MAWGFLIDRKEHYLSYADFPWFMDATVKNIAHVERESEDHLHGPELDVDLTIDMIDHPEAYPLKCK